MIDRKVLWKATYWLRQIFHLIKIVDIYFTKGFDLTIVIPLFKLSHTGSDNSLFLILFKWTLYELCIWLLYHDFDQWECVFPTQCSILKQLLWAFRHPSHVFTKKENTTHDIKDRPAFYCQITMPSDPQHDQPAAMSTICR